MLNRRKFLVGTSAVAAASLSLPGILRADTGPIRIGVITTLTGPGQLYGNYIKDGCELASQLINAKGGVNGRPIELVIRDDKNSPDGALAAFRELTGAGVKLFAQGTFTANVMATLPHLKDNDVTMLVVGTSSLAITHEAFTPHMFRLGYSSPMAFGAYGDLMTERNPEINSWTLIRTDVQALKDISDAFGKGVQKRAEAQGRKVEVGEPILVPYGAPDFRNQIARVASAGTDALFNCLQGADGISYYNQARSFGLDSRYKLICESGGELAVAKALGQNMLKSLWGWTGWYPQGMKDNPTSDALHKAFVDLRQDEYPNWYVGVAHDCIMTLAKGVEATGSTASADLIPGIEGLSYQGATGTVGFRKEDHSFAGDLTYIRFGKDEASKLGWSVFETVQLPGADYLEPATPGKPLNAG